MKRFYIAFLLAFLSFCAYSQVQNDGFSSYEEMSGNTVIMYDVFSYFQIYGPFAYERVGDKYKVIKDASVYKSIDGVQLEVKEIVPVKKKRYLHIINQDDSRDLYLILDGKIDFLSISRSTSYWLKEFRELSQEYGYILFPSALTENVVGEKVLLDKYLPLNWKAVHMPKTIDGDVFLECNVGQSQQFWSYDDICANKSFFVNARAYNAEKAEREARLAAERREQERRDSIADRTRVIEARILHSTKAEAALEREGISYQERDTLYLSVFGYEDKEDGPYYNKVNTRYYKGYTLGKEIMIPASDLTFTERGAKDFIDRRGFAGTDRRKITAKNNDASRTAEYTALKQARYEWAKGRMEALYKFRNQKKILILNTEYSFSTYKFGLKFEVYNCYNKDIKYIDMRIVAFNAVGDPQRDDIGNFAKDIRCIGPLAKGEEGTYDFDELFWDDDNLIKRLEVVEVKVTLSDNSKVVYTGKNQVDLHNELHYGEQVLKILHEGEDKM